ncbi:GAF domain-containing protein [bacterium]|nr:GAF domain-containing protein [bacterium]NIN91531.1 GAF domain-containing protein [bacterium]NIO17936.1 GAF domain-containing protein [bacterium]NIO72917.1 GAF domain-containing protein [bacterium]
MDFFLTLATILFLVVVIIYLVAKYRKERQLRTMLKEAEDEIEEHVEDLEILLSFLLGIHEFGVATSGIVEIDRLAKLIVINATRLLRTEIGSLMLVDKETNMLEIVAARGLPEELVKNVHIPIGKGIAGKVAEEGEPILCENIETDKRFSKQSNDKYSSKSFVSVPLKVQNRVIGVLSINNKESKQKFNEKDLRLLTILAEQSARTIENAELYKHMQDTYLGTIQTLARAIDAKDPYTKGHSDRVTRYAVKIAKEMNLSQSAIRNIEYSALIHDIGKIGIQESILTKKGGLSGTEYEIVKMHPLIGESIITPVKFLNGVAPLILYHHERFDGKGYLEGLRGEAIPLGARIISVADAFDAMTSDRPYRKALTKKRARDELEKESGKRFDPQVIEAFLRLLDRGELEKEGL